MSTTGSRIEPPGEFVAERATTVRSADYEALTELFLGPTEIPRRSTPRRDTPLDTNHRCELLVMGHLPVQSGPWAGQYARTVAAREGRPVALLRLRDGHAIVDVFGDGIDMEPAASLEDAIDRARGVASTWLIRVDEPTERVLARDRRIAGVSLLTGANEMAIVNSYRVVKSLLAGGENDAPRATVRVVILGAAADKGESAAKRLREAAEGFLDRSIEVTVGSSRIERGPFCAVWSGPVTLPPERVFAQLVEDGDATRDEAGPPSVPPARATKATEPLERQEAPGPAWPGSIARHVAGLTPIELPHPLGARIEIAIDAERCLCVVADARADPARGVRDAERAERWLREHRALVDMAIFGAGNSRPSGPTPPPATSAFSVHVLVGDPSHAVGVAALGWHRHLVAPAEQFVSGGVVRLTLD